MGTSSNGTLIENPDGNKSSVFCTVAIWWAVFSIPIFIFVKEPQQKEKVGFGKAIRTGIEAIR